MSVNNCTCPDHFFKPMPIARDNDKLPGNIAPDVWRLILANLEKQDQLNARRVSKKFRHISLFPCPLVPAKAPVVAQIIDLGMQFLIARTMVPPPVVPPVLPMCNAARALKLPESITWGSNAPLWLREFLICPERLHPDDRQYLLDWGVENLPTFAFKKHFTFGELRKFHPYFKLCQWGMELNLSDVEQFMEFGHSPKSTLFLAGCLKTSGENYQSVFSLLSSLKPHELDAFLQSELFGTIIREGICDLHFLRWAVQNQAFLSQVLAQDPAFLSQALRNLFSICQVNLRLVRSEREWDFSRNFSGSDLRLVGRECSTILPLTYFDLLRRASLSIQEGSSISSTIFRSFFEKGCSLFESLANKDPVEIIAIILRIDRRFQGLSVSVKVSLFLKCLGDWNISPGGEPFPLSNSTHVSVCLPSNFERTQPCSPVHLLNEDNYFVNKRDVIEYKKKYFNRPEWWELGYLLIDIFGLAKCDRLFKKLDKCWLLDRPEICCALLKEFGGKTFLELLDRGARRSAIFRQAASLQELQTFLRRIKSEALQTTLSIASYMDKHFPVDSDPLPPTRKRERELE